MRRAAAPIGVPLLFAAVLLASAAGGLLAAQERDDVPKDSTRVTMRGCAKDRVFTVADRSEHEPVGADVAPGRKFRLSGPRRILDDIKRRDGTLMEVTGLVRKSDLAGPGGVSILGGRVRIGGAMPRARTSDPIRDPMYNVAVIDIESARPLPEACPAR